MYINLIGQVYFDTKTENGVYLSPPACRLRLISSTSRTRAAVNPVPFFPIPRLGVCQEQPRVPGRLREDIIDIPF